MRSGWPILLLALTLLTRPALADPFLVSMPPLTGAAIGHGFQISVPPVSARAAPSGFKVSMPVVAARTIGSGFHATLPPLRASAAQSGFVITLPEINARSTDSGFVVTMPTLRASAVDDDSASQEPVASSGDGLVCEALRGCFGDDDIRRVEADLISYGYTPGTYGRFCQDVAQSLGPCPRNPDPDDPASPAPALAGGPGPSLGTTAENSNMNRCLAFEDYMTELQVRSDAGENETAEAERLHVVMQSAQNLLLQGRSDLWCAAVTAGLR